MKTAAIYGRTSTDLQEKEHTVDSQISVLKNYAKQNNYEILEEYIDEGWSGTILARPQLDRLRDDAQKKLFESVLIYDPDRLARKFAYQAIVIEELEDLGIEIVFLNRPKAETPEDRILQGFQGLFAEYERAKILERTRRGKLHKVRDKKIIIGSCPPYGYRYVHKTKEKEGYYEIDPKEADVVKKIFDWLANEGCSLMQLRRKLHENGIKTRNSKSTKWSTSTLSRLVRNETYIGITHYNKTESMVPKNPRVVDGYKRIKKSSRRYKERKEWVAVRVPAIIDKGTFRKAQEQLKFNFLHAKRNQKRTYLLSGLVFCGNCDSRMTGDGCFKGYGRGHFYYYRCTNRIKRYPERKTCKAKSVRAELLEEIVWKKVSKLIENPVMILKHLKKRVEKREEIMKNKDYEMRSIDKQLSILKGEEKRLIKAYQHKVINLSQLKKQLASISENKITLNENKATYGNDVEQYSFEINNKLLDLYCESVEKVLPKLNLIEKQELLRLLIESVVIKGREVIVKGILPLPKTNTDKREVKKYLASKEYQPRLYLQLLSNNYNCRLTG